MYVSVLAKTLAHMIPELVDPDQTGSVRDRQTQDNIRRVLHVVDHVTKGDNRAVVLTDDVLIPITAPEVSIPRLMSTLKDFGTYSGYNLNVQNFF